MTDPDNALRDELINLLEDEEIRKDVGVANYLISTYADGATLPGDILNWAMRFDVAEMHHAKKELQSLKDPYYALMEEDAAEALDEGWKGTGADAFVERWEGLSRHVGTDEGLLQYLNKLIEDLEELIEGAQNVQRGCIGAVEDNLKGLRKKYCEALIAYGNAEDGSSSASDTFTSYAGTGVTVGSEAGPWGAAIGGLLGGLLGMTKSFNDHAEAGAEKELSQVDSAGELKGELRGLSEDITGGIGGDSTYSRGGDETTKYQPESKDKDVESEWELE